MSHISELETKYLALVRRAEGIAAEISQYEEKLMSLSGKIDEMATAHTELEKTAAVLRAENSLLVGMVAGLHGRLGEEIPDMIRHRIDEIYVESHPMQDPEPKMASHPRVEGEQYL